MNKLRDVLRYVPQNCEEMPPSEPYTIKDELRMPLDEIIPESATQPYDIKDVINLVVDDESFCEVHENYAGNIVVGFARLAGKSIGVVANQPAYLAGVLDIDASESKLTSSLTLKPMLLAASLLFEFCLSHETRSER